MENFRKRGPVIKDIGKVQLPKYKQISLDNDIPVYVVPLGTQDILKIEIVFNSGRTFESKKVASRACNSQIKEGCASYNSKELVEHIDFYGASLRTTENLDNCSVSLFCLGKHFDTLLPVLKEVITTPRYPEEELRKYKQNNAERLKIELTKSDVIAYRAITEQIFTNTHPYGYNSEIEDYLALERDDILHHYNSNYGANTCSIFISGKVTEQHLQAINKVLGHGINNVTQQEKIPTFTERVSQNIHIDNTQDLQTAIKMGLRLFPRSHKDYPGMYVLNAILGGYFGSRLMSNIREDKGYTYNIYSEVDVMKYDGLFMIGTEVGHEYASATMAEIQKEILSLKETLVPEEELKMVRNYLLGRILNFIDGPFNTSRLLKTIFLSNLPNDYFDHLIHVIKTIEPHELRNLANQYWREEDLWTVTVGKQPS